MSTSTTTPEGTVTLFCRPGCRKCERVHDWLQGLGFTIELIDPSTDDDARTYLLDRGFRGVPVVRTPDGRLAWGMEPHQLRAVLPLLEAADEGASADDG